MMKIYIAPLGCTPPGCAPVDIGAQGGQYRSASAYSLLEYAYRLEYGDVLPEIKKTPNGKPFFPERPGIHFSLSHAFTHVACALSEFPVGVDIESPREISKRAMRFFCSDEELVFFDLIHS